MAPDLEDSESVDGLVSIIIPMFNSERWIKQTLFALINQTYKNWECLIINDGSTDGSPELVNLVQSKYPDAQITMIHVKTSGVSTARNIGIEAAKGKYIAFLDSDDLWREDKLEKQVQELKQNKTIGAVLCDFYISSSKTDGSTKKQRLISHKKIASISKGWLSMQGHGAFISSTLMYRNSHDNLLLRFDKDLNTVADLYFFLTLEEITNVGYVKLPLVEYRQHANQMHLNPNTLKIDYPKLLSKLKEIPYPLTKQLIESNIFVMSAILNFNKRAIKVGFGDIASAFRIRPLSIVTLPLYILSKRVRSSLARIIGR